eukprot:TRINITY_DN32204_c0_g1_i7.p1 TRINITY_DN32204_c0_g1~~TRINITY_DN32204_c0_g1_i7.p1  ORF type:complete len:164 (+),score=22.99 TRINITY_DN32204_c0_g1_i7:160-651(+)
MYPENMAGMATTKRRKRSPPPPVVTPPVVTPPGAGGVMPSGQPQPFTLQMPFGVVLPSTSSQPPQPLLLPFLSGPIPIQPLSMPTSTAPSRPVPIQPLPPSTAPSHPVPHTSTAHYVPHSTLCEEVHKEGGYFVWSVWQRKTGPQPQAVLWSLVVRRESHPDA